jgi:hypothetical protein
MRFVRVYNVCIMRVVPVVLLVIIIYITLRAGAQGTF